MTILLLIAITKVRCGSREDTQPRETEKRNRILAQLCKGARSPTDLI